MGLVTILQTESASNVLLEQGLLGNLSNEGSIDGLLVSNTLSLDLLLDSLVTKELLLSGSLLGSLLAGEVGNVELLDLDGLNVDTGGGGNDVTSVNSSKRNTVDLEGTRDKESRVLKSLEEDNSLTTETTSKGDKTSDPLKTLDAAFTKLDKLTGELGAVQNRLESTIANLNNVVNNLSNARSRIQDADYATEVSNMSKAQILQQAGTSVLAQANQVPQTVLSLLR